MTAVLVAVVLVPMVVACGLGSGAEKDAVGDAPKKAESKAQSFEIGKTVRYAGLKFTFGKLSYDPANVYPEPELAIDTAVENVAPTEVRPETHFTIKIDGQFVEGRLGSDLTLVPAGETARTTTQFDLTVGQKIGDLSKGELLVGTSRSLNAVVPLGAGGQVLDWTPKTLFDTPVVKTTKSGRITYRTCSLQADSPSPHEQVEKDMRTIVCYLDMQQTVDKLGGEQVDTSDFILRLPDDTVITAAYAPLHRFYSKERVTDAEIVFKIRWPAPGAYTIETEFGDGTSTVPLTVPA